MLVVYRYLWFKCAHKISRIRFVVFLLAVLVSALECRRALPLVCKLDGSNVCAPCPFTANPLRILKIDHVLKSVAEHVYYSPAPSCQLVRTSLTAILRNWQDGWTCIVIASTADCGGEVQMCRGQKNAGAEDSCSSFFQQNC